MTTRFRLAEPRFVADMIDGEVLAVDLSTGAYFNLRDWSAVVFTHLTSGAAVDETAAVVRLADPTATTEEVQAFCDRLIELGMLRPDDAASFDRLEIDLPTTPWGELEIETYDDMADLILLDPVHDVDPDGGWPQRP